MWELQREESGAETCITVLVAETSVSIEVSSEEEGLVALEGCAPFSVLASAAGAFAGGAVCLVREGGGGE